MSLEVDLSEFRTAYLAEMEELGIAAEAAVGRLDALVDQPGGSARAPVRDLLRAVHTMKGLSAMMNAEPIVELAHDLEELLRALDGALVPLDARRLALVAETVRGIVERAATMRDGQAPAPAPREWIENLRASLTEVVRTGAAASVSSVQAEAPAELGFDKLEADERERLERGAAEGERAVRVTFEPSRAKAEAGHTIARVRERLADVLEIVRVVPINAGGSANAGGLTFSIFGLTRSSDDVLAAAAGEVGPDSSRVVRTVFGHGPAGPARATSSPTPHHERPSPVPALSSAQAGPQESARSSSHLRVEPRRVDDAIDRVSAMLVTRSRIAMALARMGERGVDTREISAILNDSARQLRDARGALMRLRMIPTSELTERMPLVLRDLRRASTKLARFEATGTHVELDKAVADRVFPAIVHLVRNAFDHGIEEPAARAALGKPAEGCISIAFRATSNGRIELRVSDDGRGVDRPSVVAAAGRAARAPSVDALDAGGDGELLALLCRPGLSTKREASRASGRGMGMDIARKIIVDELGGALSLETRPHEGTTFVVDLPLTVAVLDAFKIKVDDEVFVVAVTVVDEIVELDPRAIVLLPTHDDRRQRERREDERRQDERRREVRDQGERRQGERRRDERRQGASAGTRLMRHRTGTLALFDVAELLGMEPPEDAVSAERARVTRQALIVRKAGEPVALAIDRVIGQVETVVRPLEDALVQVPCVSGSTDLGDGRPRLVLDLVALAGAAAAWPQEARRAPRRSGHLGSEGVGGTRG